MNLTKKDETPRPSDQTDGAKPRQVLELRKVTFGVNPDAAICLRRQDLTLCQGDLALIRCNAAQQTRSFASMLQGLVAPLDGRVFFEGKDWAEQDVESQFRMRGRIGRVFDGQAWIANLNVMENIKLAREHHGIPARQLNGQIRSWADRFELEHVHRKRPAFVAASILQVHQWIRAFLGHPSLVILERPMKSVSPSLLPRLTAAVEQLRRQGCAVLWITGDGIDDAIRRSGQAIEQTLLIERDWRPGRVDPSRVDSPNQGDAR